MSAKVVPNALGGALGLNVCSGISPSKILGGRLSDVLAVDSETGGTMELKINVPPMVCPITSQFIRSHVCIDDQKVIHLLNYTVVTRACCGEQRLNLIAVPERSAIIDLIRDSNLLPSRRPAFVEELVAVATHPLLNQLPPLARILCPMPVQCIERVAGETGHCVFYLLGKRVVGRPSEIRRERRELRVVDVATELWGPWYVLVAST
jgi:hypothetical protein